MSIEVSTGSWLLQLRRRQAPRAQPVPVSPDRAAWELATDLRNDRRALERYQPHNVGSHAYAVLLAAERRAVARAWSLEVRT